MYRLHKFYLQAIRPALNACPYFNAGFLICAIFIPPTYLLISRRNTALPSLISTSSQVNSDTCSFSFWLAYPSVMVITLYSHLFCALASVMVSVVMPVAKPAKTNKSPASSTAVNTDRLDEIDFMVCEPPECGFLRFNNLPQLIRHGSVSLINKPSASSASNTCAKLTRISLKPINLNDISST